jgi:hypothetical protein
MLLGDEWESAEEGEEESLEYASIHRQPLDT